MMQYEKTTYAGDVQILKRKPFEGIAMTLDFSGVADTLESGKKVVKFTYKYFSWYKTGKGSLGTRRKLRY